MSTPVHSERGYRSFLPPLHDADPAAESAVSAPDRRDGAVYVVDDDLLLAVDVALATNRPLLLRGEPGSGKSSLAAFLARNLNWRYYEHVVTSRTRARDLLWTFDAVRKLADASAPEQETAEDLFKDDPRQRDHRYVEPGVMWWVIDQASAARRGLPTEYGEPDSPATEPNADVNEGRDPTRAVILIDEIDKADPDVPNGLLVPLGSRQFAVAETGTIVRDPTPDGERARTLVILTTNEERDLPAAFLRRCVVLELKVPRRPRLIEIARRHAEQWQDGLGDDDIALFGAVADRFLSLRREARKRAVRQPSTAEYLDAIRACRDLGIGLDSGAWKKLERLVLDKTPLSSTTQDDEALREQDES